MSHPWYPPERPPLRLIGLDSYLTREPDPPYEDYPPVEDEPEPCGTCMDRDGTPTGYVGECEAEDRECTCPGGVRCIDCNAKCPQCDGDRFI